jgi:hypothetical protein
MHLDSALHPGAGGGKPMQHTSNEMMHAIDSDHPSFHRRR